jgi:hypothetical protein
MQNRELPFFIQFFSRVGRTGLASPYHFQIRRHKEKLMDVYLKKSTGHSAFSFFSISGNTDKCLGKRPTEKKVNERNLKRIQCGNSSIKYDAYGLLYERMRIIISDCFLHGTFP